MNSMKRQNTSGYVLTVALTLLLTISSCSDKNQTVDTVVVDDNSQESEFIVRGHFSRLFSIENGPIPDATGGLLFGMTAFEETKQSLIVGSEISMRLDAKSEAYFDTIFASVDPVEGERIEERHFRIDYESARIRSDFSIKTPSWIPAGTAYVLKLAIGKGGSVSETRTLLMNTVEPGSSELTVTLEWTSKTDLDLSLVEPSITHPDRGNIISSLWGVSSESGGKLVGGVTDGNGVSGCTNSSNERTSEKIQYEAVTPRSGSYIVRSTYREDCGSGPEYFTLTVYNRGVTTTYDGILQEGDIFESAPFSFN